MFDRNRCSNGNSSCYLTQRKDKFIVKFETCRLQVGEAKSLKDITESMAKHLLVLLISMSIIVCLNLVLGVILARALLMNLNASLH
jgi:hypothetical protein